MSHRFAFMAAGIITAGSGLVAQQKAVFHSEANYVEIDAVVTDKQGNFVPGLTTADFEVREAHQPQHLEIADMVDLGTSTRPGSLESAPMRFRPGLLVDPASVSGRIYLLFFDYGSMTGALQAGKNAREFVTDFVQPGDLVGIWDSSSTVTFTTDKPTLLKALPPNMAAGGAADLRQLMNAADFLGGMQGRRKSILYFSGGLSDALDGFAFTGLPSLVQARPPSRSTYSGPPLSLSDIATRTDVQVYAIDARGLVAPPLWNGTPMFSTSANDTAADTARNLSASLDAVNASVDALTALANETGGLAIVNTNSNKKGFARIVEDNTRYYVLGYASSVTHARGRPVALSIKTLKPALKVRARRSYVPR